MAVGDPVMIAEGAGSDLKVSQRDIIDRARKGLPLLENKSHFSDCVISPDMFVEWSKPYLEEVVHYIKENTGMKVSLHICGRIDRIMNGGSGQYWHSRHQHRQPLLT